MHQKKHPTTTMIRRLNFLFLACSLVSAWTSSTSTTPRTIQTDQCLQSDRTSLSYRAQSLQKFQTFAAGGLSFIFQGPEDEDCKDEEECEINWDFMPGGGGGVEVEQVVPEPSPTEAASSVDTNPLPLPEESMTNPTTTTASNVARSKSMSDVFAGTRVRLEVNWQIDECKTDIDMCEDFCEDCAGSGRVACRFCRGTGMLAMNGEFKPCPICDHGYEKCQSCRGTGFIAPWALTMGAHLKGKKPLAP
jgi:hypothetical protein